MMCLDVCANPGEKWTKIKINAKLRWWPKGGAFHTMISAGAGYYTGINAGGYSISIWWKKVTKNRKTIWEKNVRSW